MGLIVGIDLGTTYSVISYIDPITRDPKIIKNKNGNSTTPSVIGFKSRTEYVIGEDAKAMEESGDVNTASFYKLHMGNHAHKICLMGMEYTAKELSGLFLKRLIEDAEKVVGEKITDAVITVPAYFQDAAKSDTIAAGEQAGLKVLNIINEPTAACVAYGLKNDSADRNILIYDLGGGTFDVTIAAVKKGHISVLGTIGHNELGGRDWDKAVCEWLVSRFYEETGIDIAYDSETISAVMVKVEQAKKQLSVSSMTEIVVDNGEEKRRFKLTRQDFEELTAYQLKETTDLIDELFENIDMSWSQIDGAVLVGGSTKMPMVKNYITSHNIKILDGVHPDEAVAIGAAIQANTSKYCTLLPAEQHQSSLSLLPSQLNLAQLPGAVSISDVISHSLGMIAESSDGERFVNDIMIHRNTPCIDAHTTKRRELRVSRKKENNHLDIYLLQGESDIPSYCTVAKKYTFYDIDYVEGGKTLLDITYLHTINGTIDISAVQTETGKTLKFREEEIERDMSWVDKCPEDVYGSAAVPVTGALVMALDLSGSMSDTKNGVMAIDAAKAAMKKFTEQFIDYDIKIGIVGFSERTKVACKPTTDIRRVKSAIDSLTVGETGFGTSADPLPKMYEMLKSYSGEPVVYAVVLTDGAWAEDSSNSAKAGKPKFIKMGFEIVGMGFGTANLKFLREISTKDEFASVDDITKLESNLSSIARVIVE